jgi:hypothetical protein
MLGDLLDSVSDFRALFLLLIRQFMAVLLHAKRNAPENGPKLIPQHQTAPSAYDKITDD